MPTRPYKGYLHVLNKEQKVKVHWDLRKDIRKEEVNPTIQRARRLR